MTPGPAQGRTHALLARCRSAGVQSHQNKSRVEKRRRRGPRSARPAVRCAKGAIRCHGTPAVGRRGPAEADRGGRQEARAQPWWPTGCTFVKFAPPAGQLRQRSRAPRPAWHVRMAVRGLHARQPGGGLRVRGVRHRAARPRRRRLDLRPMRPRRGFQGQALRGVRVPAPELRREAGRAGRRPPVGPHVARSARRCGLLPVQGVQEDAAVGLHGPLARHGFARRGCRGFTPAPAAGRRPAEPARPRPAPSPEPHDIATSPAGRSSAVLVRVLAGRARRRADPGRRRRC